MLYTLRELECRDVINLCDGRFLGHITDVEFDKDGGKLTAVFLSTGGFWSMGKDEIRIPWEDIRCVGEDAVLVEYRRDCKDCGCTGHRPRRAGWFCL